MTQSKRIAITGGIGSGKTVVLNLLRKHGYAAFSCDEIYGELCAEPQFLRGLSELFPYAVKNGALDRAALAKTVFSDAEERKKLDLYTHPRIMERLLAQMAEYPLSFAEVPLLFEGGYQTLFDGVIVVLRERAARLCAVAARSGLSEAEIAGRMSSQFSYEELPHGCAVLQNDGTVDDLERALLEAISSF